MAKQFLKNNDWKIDNRPIHKLQNVKFFPKVKQTRTSGGRHNTIMVYRLVGPYTLFLLLSKDYLSAYTNGSAVNIGSSENKTIDVLELKETDWIRVRTILNNLLKNCAWFGEREWNKLGRGIGGVNQEWSPSPLPHPAHFMPHCEPYNNAGIACNYVLYAILSGGHYWICNNVRRTVLHMQFCPPGRCWIRQLHPPGRICICSRVRPRAKPSLQ